MESTAGEDLCWDHTAGPPLQTTSKADAYSSHLHTPDEMNAKKSLKSLRLHLSQNPPSSLNSAEVQQNVQHWLDTKPVCNERSSFSSTPEPWPNLTWAPWKPSRAGSSPSCPPHPLEGLGKQEICLALLSTSSVTNPYSKDQGEH